MEGSEDLFVILLKRDLAQLAVGMKYRMFMLAQPLPPYICGICLEFTFIANQFSI